MIKEQYLLSLDYIPPRDFSEMYPHAEKAAIDLLQRMLTFGRLNIRMNE